MVTENLSTLKIHKLTQEQYDRELDAGRIDPNALYLTPDDANNIFVQNTEPLDAEDGDLWIDLDSTGSVTGGGYVGDGTSIDLSKYALKSEIPTRTSQLANDSNYMTESEVISYINETILGGAW